MSNIHAGSKWQPTHRADACAQVRRRHELAALQYHVVGLSATQLYAQSSDAPALPQAGCLALWHSSAAGTASRWGLAEAAHGCCVCVQQTPQRIVQLNSGLCVACRCEIHTFDCTYDGVSQDPKRHHYHKVRLTPTRLVLKQICAIMAD